MNPQTLIAERSEQAVWSALWQAADSETRTQLGMSNPHFRDADCLMMTSMPNWFFNRVIGLGLEQPVTEADINSLIEMYHSNGVPIGISLCPQSQPTQIKDWLEDRGFVIANQWAKMIRDTSPPNEVRCELQIERASTDHTNIVAELIIKGFEVGDAFGPVFGALTNSEENHVYLAWDDDTPVAVGVLTLYGHTGHLNTAATLSEYRGRGAQGAIMARRIKDGIELGCQNFITETWYPGEETNHSYNNMLRHGFGLAYIRPNWVLPVSDD